MIDLKIDEGGSLGVLTLEGEITITEAGELKKALLEGLNRAKQLLVEIENITALDLTCLQLLCSAERSYPEKEKVITFSGKIPEAFRNTAEKAGYLKEFGKENLLSIGGN